MKKNILLELAVMLLLVPSIAYGQDSNKTVAKEGTTILVSVSKRDITIAADSKIVNTEKPDWSQNIRTFITTKCKIRHVGNFFFAAEGQVGASRKEYFTYREIDVLN